MLTRSEIRSALKARGHAQEELFEQARRLRDQYFGPAVVMRGVVEITNVCRVNCDYCPMRRDNTRVNDRYFMSREEVLRRSRLIREAGIDVILLQGGETPRSFTALRAAIPGISDLYRGRVEVLLNLGNMTGERYAELRALGATSYILKHETSDPDLHWRMRHERLEERLRCLKNLLDLGYRVGTGLIAGLPGQQISSMVDDIELAGELGVHMCSVSPFVPAPDTPLSGEPAASVDLALNIIACLRICYPQLLIPAVSALEKTDTGGQSRGLAAGANVITVNFTGGADQHRYLIYGKDRFVVKMEHAKNIVHRAGLRTRGSVFLPDA
jgi:biotin synthase